MASFEEALVFIGTVLVGFFLARAVGLIAHLRRRAMIPRRCRVYKSHHFDSTIWDDFKVRDGDIIIATAYKSGTTWMQQIVSELLFKEGEGPNVAECSPWLDFGGMPREETLAMLDAQTHRRFIKTHLPATAMPYYPQAKYIYVRRCAHRCAARLRPARPSRTDRPHASPTPCLLYTSPSPRD